MSHLESRSQEHNTVATIGEGICKERERNQPLCRVYTEYSNIAWEGENVRKLVRFCELTKPSFSVIVGFVQPY